MENNMEDVIYLKVPISYKPTYDKLLRCLADFGKEALDDCNKNTKSVNSNVISCWNMFQTAIACYELGRFKEANLFIFKDITEPRADRRKCVLNF